MQSLSWTNLQILNFLMKGKKTCTFDILCLFIYFNLINAVIVFTFRKQNESNLLKCKSLFLHCHLFDIFNNLNHTIHIGM